MRALSRTRHVRLFVALLIFCSLHAAAAGAEDARVHALTGARVFVSPDLVIEEGVLVVRDGVVVAVGPDVKPPPDAWIWELGGRTIYPGMIEVHLPVEAPGLEAGEGKAAEVPRPPRGAAHTPPRVRPRARAATAELGPKAREEWREAGFTTVHLAPARGIFRGRGAVLNLGRGSRNEQLVVSDGLQHLAFEHGDWDDAALPGSLMGAVAIARQTLLDARWHERAWTLYRKKPGGLERPVANADLEALGDVAAGRASVVMVSADVLDTLRLGRLVEEFSLRGWVVGSGDEYRRLEEVASTGLAVALPVDFPPAPAALGENEWLEVPLRSLRHWDRAPSNPAWVHGAGIRFALTSNGLDKPEAFREAVGKAMRRGLPEDAALAAVTTEPARLLGLEERLGTLEAGRIANFLVTDGPLFAKKTKVLETWVDGRRFVVHRAPGADLVGNWNVVLSVPLDGWPREGTLELKRGSGSLKVGRHKAKLRDVELEDGGRFRFLLDAEDLELPAGAVRVEGMVRQAALEGKGALANGSTLHLEGTREEDGEADEPAAETAGPPAHEGGAIRSPETVLVRGGVIWTSGPLGVLGPADMLVRDGRVVRLGPDLKVPPGAEVIEASGRHVTPGLIDPHNHSAIVGGVNEGTRATSAEVRIGDVVNSETVNIYRQMAGGVTAMLLLHGSANPIGGQSASVKLRWGEPPDALFLEGAAPTIKFALGENVKQSNWGDRFRTRFPQTRMGVEQAFREKFLEALDYREEWREWERGMRGGLPPRRDLQLDALVEVLDGERMVHCHSYRQDEILMLIRVAEEFGFTVGTFTHVLEGYKVADEMAAHGSGGSCFSDWWAYKFEVYDAIPYNGAIMWDRGVLVSFNSDSTELARRLNMEAAKAVRYGGVPKEEALKFVTINPAIQMGAGERIGSLEPGKDADFVVWSGDPFSSASRVEQTWIDGKLYFDRAHDLEMRERVAAERAALVEKAKKKGDGGGGGGGETGWRPPYFRLEEAGGAHCMPSAHGEVRP